MRPTLSSVVLILTNLIPIAGVLWFDWSVLEILLLYWTESVAIGLINVLRMATCTSNNLLAGFFGARGEVPASASVAMEAAGTLVPASAVKAIVIPFFVIHYGLFCFGHAAAVVGLFSSAGAAGSLTVVWPLTNAGFWAAAGAIFVSHLVSFFANYIGRGENRRTGLAALMARPYGRIVAMHVAIIAGGAFVTWLGNPLPMLIVLVVAKTAADLKLHLRERLRFA